nr:DUF4198 domain-containing protein [Sphingomonas sp. Y57]
MKRFPARLLAAVAILALPAAASAHRQWMVPNATVFSGTNSWVTVDAAASNDLFFADHQPMRLDGVKVWAPDGSEGAIANGSTGRYRSTFDVKLDKPGTWKIGTFTSSVMGSFKVNGEERRVGGRPGGAPAGAGMGPGGPGGPEAAARRAPPVSIDDIPADATDVKLTEVIGRNELYITADAPSTAVFTPTGKGIEFQPVTHPDELVAGEPASFRFLVDGKPANGLKVTVVPGGKRYRNDDGAREFTTGADGVAKIDWPTPGMYWINASLTDDKPSTPRATQRRMSYVTTVEVLLP